MTTDITELAQREKFEAWAEHACAAPWGYLKKRRTTEGYSEQIYTCMWTAWKAAGAELVEALEKAHGMEAYWKTQCRGITDHCEKLQAQITAASEQEEDSKSIAIRQSEIIDLQDKRIAELESRSVTVKLPKEHSATEFLFPVAVYSAQELTAALTQQGIKWEAE